MRHDERNTERIALTSFAPSARLSLLVMGGGGVFTYPLADRGEITIGRSVRCGICIEDPKLSREHALLRVARGGGSVEIVDLGSSNGTCIGDRTLVAHEATPLAVGEIVAVGSALLMLQPASAAPRLRHLWSHGYFEARLEDECVRAHETGRPFAIVRLRAAVAPKVIEAWLAEHLRPIDVVATYAPDEYEILLSEVDHKSALGLVARLRSDLARLGPFVDGDAGIGVACYPANGRTPEELIACAAPASDEADDGDERAASAKSEKKRERALEAREPVPGGAIDRLRPIVERVAEGTIPVLVVGETGVGKDVLASSIHALSPRAKKPFVCLNCAALPENLIESELFGYERGAFTGAMQSKAGLLEVADGGTVFLDEVAELPLGVQAKLLRLLDQREVNRLGGLKPRKIDVRFVAATNRDLEAEVQLGTFREDLFYRLNAVLIVVPPLRERLAEIAPLARAFAAHAARELGRDREPVIAAAAMTLLEGYTWPGNVRELRNVVERAVLLSGDTHEITLDHLPYEKMGRVLPTRDSQRGIRRASAAPATTHAPRAAPQGDDRARVVSALERCHGNQTHAAKMLGVSRRTLITRMEAYGLPRPRKKPGATAFEEDRTTDAKELRRTGGEPK